MGTIRACDTRDIPAILEIINEGAEAYRGVIPADCWHEPYFPENQMHDELAAGVHFRGYEVDGVLVGVMGLQSVRDVELIRHAYVRPAYQRYGIGGKLLAHLRDTSRRRFLIGTWAAAEWAISFYRRNGFELVGEEQTSTLLATYWTVSARQRQVSVVLSARAATTE